MKREFVTKIFSNLECEDKHHVMTGCSLYDYVRKELFNKVQEHYHDYPDLTRLHVYGTFNLMSNTDLNILIHVANFIHSNFLKGQCK